MSEIFTNLWFKHQKLLNEGDNNKMHLSEANVKQVSLYVLVMHQGTCENHKVLDMWIHY